MEYFGAKVRIEFPIAFMSEANSMLRQRGEKLGMEPLALLSSLGDRADELDEIHRYPDEKAAAVLGAFFSEFAMLIHMLSPVMEQLETSVSRHVKFVEFPTHWEDHCD